METYKKVFEGIAEHQGKLIAIIKEKSVKYNPDCEDEKNKALDEIENWYEKLAKKATVIRFTSSFGSLPDQKVMENIYIIAYGGYPYTSEALIKYVHSSGVFIKVKTYNPNVQRIVNQINKVLNEYKSIDEYIISYLNNELNRFNNSLTELENKIKDNEISDTEKEEIKEEIIELKTSIDKINGDLFSIKF